MSGIAGIVPPPGAPVDAAVLERMASCLSNPFADGTRARVLEGCGLAHALLRTGDEDDAPPQPFSLDGRAWTIADARIDGRDELVRELRGAGEEARPDAPAAELILRAWAAWGAGCVDRLLGDFAFAVWDAPRRTLFCARDPLGLKQFFHASPGGAFVFSSSLDCALAHPGVGRAVDEAAVADFLVHGFHQDGERTIRREVRALAPGHALEVRDGRMRVRRWWTLPVDEPLRLRGPGEYAERFVDLLGAAVRDRMPRGGVSIFLSGGRDSPAVGAMAREAARGGDRQGEIRGFTAVYRRLFADDEGRWAEMAGRALEIPITWLPLDGYRVFERWEADPLFARPEPTDSALMAIEVDQWSQAASHARVLLTGFGGDAVLRESRSRLTRLALGGHLLRAAYEGLQYARHHRRLPRPGVRTWLRTRGTRQGWNAEMPPWLADDFVRRAGVAERIAAQNAREMPPHPARPEAGEQLASPLWPHLFRWMDPGTTRIPLEVRHPFFDLRLVRFLLSVPPAQWYNDKGLLRIGMRGRLPEALLARPKTPLAGDPLAARHRAEGDAWLDGRALGPEAAPFVDADRVPRAAGGRMDAPADPLWLHLRPLALSLWLRRGA
ncbi:asparagine synthetase B family protein [Longimicrobium sp.]|uniref:asparagine synthetase B family protein n=1 Tax=Longimicrobium sp. TaxID=2029185 RepID=UPI002BD4F74D|nr:asparagine synthase-related protein [Longimicrobium sp.]HSU13335.1 asparagine synthase-related protein [Longimicrobium sp.]